MVCAKCEKKLAKSTTSSLACNDVWAGPSSTSTSNDSTSLSGPSRQLNENKLLSSKARSKYNSFVPSQSSKSKVAGPVRGIGGEKGKGVMLTLGKCEKCKSTVPKEGARFCQGCAYKSGICSMCGKQVLDTTMYKQTAK